MNNELLVDEIDLFAAYGFFASDAYGSFLRMLPRQEPPSYKWEGDKTEFDLSAPAFDPVEIEIPGAIQADNESDFWTKWNGLRQLLTAPGERVVQVVELSSFYKFFYVSQPDSRLLTPIKGGGRVVYQLSLKLMLTDFAEGFEPGGNGGFVKIKNQEDETIATVQAPGEFQVIQFSGIRDDGSGVYEHSIIDNL